MRPWLRRTLFGAVGASMLFAAFAAGAWRGHGWCAMSDGDPGRAKTRWVEHLGRRLDLDDTQKARLGTLIDRAQEQRRALTGGTDPRAELAAVIAGPAFDRTRAQALVEAKTAAVGSGSPALIAALADFYDGLRPEQQQQVRDFMNRRHHGRA